MTFLGQTSTQIPHPVQVVGEIVGTPESFKEIASKGHFSAQSPYPIQLNKQDFSKVFSVVAILQLVRSEERRVGKEC